MAPVSQHNIELIVELDDVPYNCQVIDAEHIPPGFSTSSTVTETACPGGVVVEESGTGQPGSLRGTVFTDTSDTGITWVLAEAWKNRVEMTYRIVHYPELGPTGAIEESGTCKVASFSYGSFKKPGAGRHPIDLALLDTTGPIRPVAAA